MPMKGFDAKFADLPDYILGITHEIWEERRIDTLHDYYTPNIVVRSPGTIVRGNENVIAKTMATLAEFPDRQLLGEDVIWSGDEDNGFLSSHRVLCVATHAGDGRYGAATGKRVTYRAHADCAARNNQVFDEWLIRDHGAIVRQLGVHPKDYAADEIAREGGPITASRPFTPDQDGPPAYTGTGNDHEVGERYADFMRSLMRGALNAVPDTYDRAVHLELPGGRAEHGWDAADCFWLGLRSSFPNAEFAIHHQIGRTDDGLSPRAAIRWSLDGTHEGFGAFGPPTGAPVHVMGISHAEFGPWGLRREWVLIDETAIWKQILLHTG